MLAILVCLLAAAVLFVSLTRRAGLGSVLGYLVAGVVIGPSCLRLVSDVHQVSEISELGVLMLLFLIGLELRLSRIWLMRKAVFGLGGAQVALCGAAMGYLAYLAGAPPIGAAIVGLGLALSSTAIVLPMLGERELLSTAAGRDSFSVLLFQDLASVPMVAMVPLLAGGGMPEGSVWIGVAKAAAGVAGILVAGRFGIRPLFRLVGGMRSKEVFTATALLVVIAAAALAQLCGLPVSLGAFAAGVILSESEYRHEVQADVEPFEGILLGFFFISVGMGANIRLAFQEPGLILLGLVLMLSVKILIGYGLARLRKQNGKTAMRFALALPQGSEFAFVLFGAAVAAGALDQIVSERATLVIALSMLVSPILFALSENYLIPALNKSKALKPDTAEDAKPTPVIICGFGRFGQILGRILRLRGIPFNALDPDAENVEGVRKFGSQAYYGDPSRLDLLTAVGAERAKVLILALPDVETSIKVVETVQRNFPDLPILARARNRNHAHLLMDRGIEVIVRETYFSALRLSEAMLAELGVPPDEARRTLTTFREHDEQMLIDQHAVYKDEKQLIQTSAQAMAELERLVAADRAPPPS